VPTGDFCSKDKEASIMQKLWGTIRYDLGHTRWTLCFLLNACLCVWGTILFDIQSPVVAMLWGVFVGLTVTAFWWKRYANG
jgi:hypothetical protein